MTETLAVAASIIAVIQISGSVISLCRQFIGKARDADKEIFQIINTVTALKGILEFLNSFANDDENKPQLALLYSLCGPDAPLETCRTALAHIESKLRSPKRDHTGVLKAVTWPWRWKEIAPILENIEKQKMLMLLAMQGDSTRAILTIGATVKDKKRLKILQWISVADFSSRHEAVSRERVKNSGTWFLRSEPFQNWVNAAASNLLCYQGIRKVFTLS